MSKIAKEQVQQLAKDNGISYAALMALIEVEGNRWLADYNLSTEKGLTVKKFREGHVTGNQIKPGLEQKHLHRILYKVSSHVKTVGEARESLIHSYNSILD